MKTPSEITNTDLLQGDSPSGGIFFGTLFSCRVFTLGVISPLIFVLQTTRNLNYGTPA